MRCGRLMEVSILLFPAKEWSGRNCREAVTCPELYPLTRTVSVWQISHTSFIFRIQPLILILCFHDRYKSHHIFHCIFYWTESCRDRFFETHRPSDEHKKSHLKVWILNLWWRGCGIVYTEKCLWVFLIQMAWNSLAGYINTWLT